MSSFQVLHGDVLRVLAGVPDNSVDCVVTSPPYWRLRDYGVSGQIGMERTPEEFVRKMVKVFREVRRVLAPTGVCWVNLGDSYGAIEGSTHKGFNERYFGKKFASDKQSQTHFPANNAKTRISGLRPKNLLGLPWRVAFGLQDDGWNFRQDIIWHKPNPMPESVRDRCTKSHEYLFLFTKSANYWWDADAIKEPASPDSHARYARGRSDNHKFSADGPGNQTIAKSFEHMRDRGVNPKAAMNAAGSKQNERFARNMSGMVEYRNKRSVWTLASLPTSDAHFATFPIELPEICILASCPPGGKRCDCDEVIKTPTGSGKGKADPSIEIGRAGMARERNVGGGTRPMTRFEQRQYAAQLKEHPDKATLEQLVGSDRFAHYIRTDRAGARAIPEDLLGLWLNTGVLQPAKRVCECPEHEPGIVLDPFSGAGTTGLAALKTGRRYLGIELNQQYIDISYERARRHYPLLMGVGDAAGKNGASNASDLYRAIEEQATCAAYIEHGGPDQAGAQLGLGDQLMEETLIRLEMREAGQEYRF